MAKTVSLVHPQQAFLRWSRFLSIDTGFRNSSRMLKWWICLAFVQSSSLTYADAFLICDIEDGDRFPTVSIEWH
jgi:hypothetical protein